MRDTVKDKKLLSLLTGKVSKAINKAEQALEEGLTEAENALTEIRRSKGEKKGQSCIKNEVTQSPT